MERNPFLSRPVRIHWAGWESDTYSLQRAGWQLSADQDIARCSIRVALRNEALRCVAITQEVSWQFERYAMSHGGDCPMLSIQHFACHIEVMRMHEQRCMAFQPIDAKPQFLADSTITSYDDMKWFAAPLAETKELIVDPDRIGAVLAQIAEAQLPEQEAIRKRAAMRASREGMDMSFAPQRKFHAQVISLDA